MKKILPLFSILLCLLLSACSKDDNIIYNDNILNINWRKRQFIVSYKDLLLKGFNEQTFYTKINVSRWYRSCCSGKHKQISNIVLGAKIPKMPGHHGIAPSFYSGAALETERPSICEKRTDCGSRRKER